jgi:hypothetical protein
MAPPIGATDGRGRLSQIALGGTHPDEVTRLLVHDYTIIGL